MNTDNWSKAWVKGANDLTRLWAYLSLLEEPRHHIYKSMPVWKVCTLTFLTTNFYSKIWAEVEPGTLFEYRMH